MLAKIVFAQPDRESSGPRWNVVCRLFERRFPKLVACLLDAEEDVLAYYGFPADHRRQLWSTNSLERLNKGLESLAQGV